MHDRLSKYPQIHKDWSKNVFFQIVQSTQCAAEHILGPDMGAPTR